MEQRDNSGVLFKNDRKEKENQPDYRGKCMVNGMPMDISAWIKQGQSGKFMSFAFSEPYPQDQRTDSQRQVDATNKLHGAAPFDDSLPF